MKNNIKKRGSLLPLFTALALLLGVLLPGAAYAIDVDVDAKCSVTISVNDPDSFKELISLGFEVKLYQFARMDKDANLTLLDAFTGVTADINAIKPNNEELLKSLPEALLSVIAEKSIPETASGRLDEEHAAGLRFAELPVGLYLAVPESLVTGKDDDYAISPMVISLPNGDGQKDDYWQYDISVFLKPARQDKTVGSVRIIKRLLSCNKDVLGGADAVFSVVGVKSHGEEEEVVYNNIVSLHFDAPGEDSVLIDGLPEGTVVTVTEVYPGASYELVGSDTFEATVVAGEVVTVGPFVNQYDGESLVHSTSVLNEFIYSGKDNMYNYIQRIDSNRVKPNN